MKFASDQELLLALTVTSRWLTEFIRRVEAGVRELGLTVVEKFIRNYPDGAVEPVLRLKPGGGGEGGWTFELGLRNALEEFLTVDREEDPVRVDPRLLDEAFVTDVLVSGPPVRTEALDRTKGAQYVSTVLRTRDRDDARGNPAQRQASTSGDRQVNGLKGPPFKITGNEPTPIVRDFSAFLDAVEKPSAYLTKAKQTLNRATLRALNESMLTHRTETHAKTDQEFYPLLNLFQRICVFARFHVVERVKGKLRMVPTERLAEFTTLTPAERYVALLEALWVECDWGELLPRTVTWMASAAAETVMEMLQGLPAGAPVDPAAVARESIRLEVRQHGLVLLLSFFGLVDCVAEPVPYKPGSFQLRGEVRVRRLTVTAFGSHFLRVLYDERPIGSWNAYEDMRFGAETALFLDAVRKSEEEEGATEPPADGEGEGTGEPPAFFEAFVPLIQGGLKSGLPHVEREAREGTFVFRVGLGPDLWRTVALSGKHSLKDLHLVIQEAFDFDNDHLYSFFMDGKPWSSRAYKDPRGEEPPFADDAMLGELDLFAGQRLLYLFDYGDEWRFGVGLLEIRSEPHGGPPKVLEKKGENPEQYPVYDEGGWEEE